MVFGVEIKELNTRRCSTLGMVDKAVRSTDPAPNLITEHLNPEMVRLFCRV